jgi:N-acetyl-gamma-glutamylphosphate reductase
MECSSSARNAHKVDLNRPTEPEVFGMEYNQNGPPAYLILGATGGIGSELSRRLAGKGARLVLGARSSENLKKLAAELQARHFPLDATQTDQVDRCVEQAANAYGRLDGIARESPVDLITFQEDSGGWFIDQSGHFQISHEKLEWIRLQ